MHAIFPSQAVSDLFKAMQWQILILVRIMERIISGLSLVSPKVNYIQCMEKSKENLVLDPEIINRQRSQKYCHPCIVVVTDISSVYVWEIRPLTAHKHNRVQRSTQFSFLLNGNKNGCLGQGPFQLLSLIIWRELTIGLSRR